MAFSGIPLPKIVADVGPGGGVTTAVKGANELDKQNIENRIKAIEAQYAPQMTQAKLAHEQALGPYYTAQTGLTNQQAKFYEPNILSQVGLRNAQAKEINTLLQSKLDELKTKAAQNKIINQGLSNAFPSQNSGIATNPNNQQIYQQTSDNNMQGNTPNYSSNITQNQPNNINNIPQGSALQPQNNVGNKMTYPQAAIMNHLLGLGAPQISDVNGKKIAITPWGNFTVAEGLTPQQEAMQKGLGKYNAESYGKSVDSYKTLQNQEVALDNMISQLDHPEFYNVAGPVSSFLTNWAGTPEKQQLLGSLRTSSGEIALQVAPSLKGAFTGRDQTLINTIKANPDTDMPDVFIGKLKAQKMIGSLLKERERLSAQYKYSGMPALEAEQKAARETPLSKYKSEIDNLISPKIILKNPNTGENKRFSKDEVKKLIKEKKLKITREQAKKLGIEI